MAHARGQMFKIDSARGFTTSARLVKMTNWMDYGHFAVAVFIVLSGYCLMMPVVRSKERFFKGGLREFFRRQALRILPAYYVIFALAELVTWTAHRYKGQMGIVDTSGQWAGNFTVGNVVSHLLLVHNLFPQWASGVEPAMWSVGLEWQIYFVFALLLVPVWRRFGNAAALLTAGFVGYGLPLVLPGHYDPSLWFVGLFGFGMIAAVFSFSNEPSIMGVRDRVPWGAGVVLLTLLMMGAFGLTRNIMVLETLLGLLISWLFVACARCPADAHGPLARLRNLLSARILVFVSSFSYSLYLIHGLVISRVHTVVGHLHCGQTVSYLLFIAASLAGSLGAAYLSYLFVERPFLRARGN